MIRERVEERAIPKNNLIVKHNELSNLIVDDKIIYKILNENKTGIFFKGIKKYFN